LFLLSIEGLLLQPRPLQILSFLNSPDLPTLEACVSPSFL
jgi:hypothetical protein